MNADTRSGAAPQVNAGSENCLPIGTRLSDFEITGVLGEGGFGIVYVAYDHALQRTVAIKEYMPGILAMRAADGGVTLRSEQRQDTFRLGLKSFINEARILAQFDHPALVKVYRFWEQNNTAYTAMKFYDGRTIKDIVANSPELVDEAWCRKVMGQILQALETLHSVQILHRDISPDNIIVQENGDAVLLDFGSARQIIGDMARGLTVILKPGYAPVEQYAGDASLEQGPYTDLYALSAVMYFAITQAPPPTSIGRMINDPIVPLAKQAPGGYGEQVLAAIDKGLAVLAQDRPQTIAEFRDLLGMAPLAPQPARALLAQPRTAPEPEPAPLPVVAPPMAIVPPRRAADLAPRRSRLLIGAGVAGVVALAIAALVALAPAPSQDVVAPPLPQGASTPDLASASVAAPASAPSAAGADAGGAAPAAPGAVSAPGASASAAGTAAPPPPDASFVASTLPTEPAAPPADAPAKAEAKPPAPPPNPSYRLHIKPWGTLFVDGKSRGVSPPLRQITLTPGKHKIGIVNPSFPEYQTTIEVDRNKPGTIAHDFSAARP
jgi:serine/threonine protein kinase